MGLSIKKNNKNKYQIKSTISDELYHEKNWISENDAKKVLIEKEYWDFVQKVVQINFDFPNNYYINGERKVSKEKSFSQWWLDSNCSYEVLYEEFQKITNELNIDLNYKP